MAFVNTPFQEVLAMSPDGMEIVPIWGDLLTGDPLPVDGQVRPPDRPGWGIALNRAAVRRIAAPLSSS
jgi:L-rhamnonate dehydratase